MLSGSKMRSSWHTNQERRVIRRHGGRPLVKYGFDGQINGRPVEVRSVRKDHRYRIQKNVHQNLVRKSGSYIFCKDGKTKRVPATKVSGMLSRGKWFKDRNYPHKFLEVDEIF